MTPPPDSDPPRPGPLARVRRVVATAVVGYLVLAGCGVLYAATAESAVPSGAPDLPAGVAVAGETLQCGSGGCWRELTVRWDDDPTRAEQRTRLERALGCGATNPITFRRTCTEVLAVGDGPLRLTVEYG